MGIRLMANEGAEQSVAGMEPKRLLEALVVGNSDDMSSLSEKFAAMPDEERRNSIKILANTASSLVLDRSEHGDFAFLGKAFFSFDATEKLDGQGQSVGLDDFDVVVTKVGADGKVASVHRRDLLGKTALDEAQALQATIAPYARALNLMSQQKFVEVQDKTFGRIPEDYFYRKDGEFDTVAKEVADKVRTLADGDKAYETILLAEFERQAALLKGNINPYFSSTLAETGFALKSLSRSMTADAQKAEERAPIADTDLAAKVARAQEFLAKRFPPSSRGG